jgi:hypothetical protein
MSAFVDYMEREMNEGSAFLHPQRFIRRKNFTRFQQMAKANEITEKNLFLGWRWGAIPILEKKEFLPSIDPQVLIDVDPIHTFIFWI